MKRKKEKRKTEAINRHKEGQNGKQGKRGNKKMKRERTSTYTWRLCKTRKANNLAPNVKCRDFLAVYFEVRVYE